MRTTTTIVIGAGPAGLAASRCLADRGIDHVVLERDEVACSWRHQRWDSLRLLTPNWKTTLPGCSYTGDEPDGFMTAGAVAELLVGYRRQVDAPIIEGCEVQRVESGDRGFRVHTSDGPWPSRGVVLATGAFRVPRIPAIAEDLPRSIQQIAPIRYRNPDQVQAGRVLVVGASASGVQIADELARAGREVVLAVGEHVRMPRTYRGMDIHWWLDVIGRSDERHDEIEDVDRARRLPSPQLIGSPERRDLDLNTLSDLGVHLAGRLVRVSDGRATFAGSLRNHLASADLKQARLLDDIDDHAARTGLDAEVGPVDRPEPTRPPTPLRDVDLASLGAVVWATGYRPHHPWLEPDLVDDKGAMIHQGGVLPRPGLYALGLPFLRRRRSSFIDGIGLDAAELADHLRRHLDASARTAPG